MRHRMQTKAPAPIDPPMRGAALAAARTPLTPALQREIERWFVRRGVPQLIEGYSTEQRMDARALPFIVGWLVVGTILFWGTRSEWPLLWNAAATLGTLLFIAIGHTAVRWLRGRPSVPHSQELDAIDIFIIGPLVALPAGLIDGSLREAIVAGLNSLLGIGIIYVVVALGLLEIGWWGIGRLQSEILHVVRLVSRTLPVLLILVLFLLFASEIWEAAHELRGVELAIALLLILAVAALLVVTALGAELHALVAERPEEMAAEARTTPAAPLVGRTLDPIPHPPPLSRLQRLNLTTLVLLSQLIQSVFVAGVVMVFLVCLGLLALPADLQVRWVGDGVQTLLAFDLLGEVRTLSAELLTVCALLGAVVGLYFTGLSITDAAYRAEHFSRVVEEVRELLAARAVYVAALQRRTDAPVAAEETV
jgi:hypothetical protein